jgi:general secretion pathway protein G
MTIRARFQNLQTFLPNFTKSNQGLTLVEITIVVAILATLMTYLVREFSVMGDNARIDQARLAMGNIAQDLQAYRAHVGVYPSTEEGLKALVTNPGGNKRWRGPYTDQGKLNDPWGTEFEYETDGRNIKLRSAGIDRNFGTEDDVTYPEEAATEAGAGDAAEPAEE